MSLGDTAGRSGRVPAESPYSCIATQATLSTRPPRCAGLCLPSHAKPSFSHPGLGSGQGIWNRLSCSLGSSLHGGVREEWGPSLPTRLSDPLPLAGGCGPPPPPSKIQRRKEKNEVSEDED